MAVTQQPEVYHSATELLKSRAATDPDLPILGVPGNDGKVVEYTYSQLEKATNLLAHHYASVIPARVQGDVSTKLNCALLAPTGYDYAVTEMALSRIGWVVLFVSPNNSAAAIASLCSATESTHLFIAPQYLAVSEAAVKLLVSSNRSLDLVLLAPAGVYSKSAISRYAAEDAYPVALTPAEEAPLISFIVHSSGSTGHPKPIYVSHQSMMFNVATNFGLTGFTTLPLLHNHGHSCLWRAIHAKKILWLFPASDLPLTTPNVMNILDQPSVTPEALFGVPYVYKLLGETPEGIDTLKKFKLCLFGGSAMPTELGDKLVAEGIPLVGHYGATEVGQLMTSSRDYDTDKEWAYNRPPERLKPYLRFEPRGPGVFEAIVLDGWQGKVTNNRPDKSYATSDLFVKHPDFEGYKFVGRIDDTLVLVTGEKVNPVPIELTIRGESPFVQDAIVFGAEKTQAGAIIIPSDLAAGLSKEELLERIRPAIKLANNDAPSHSRITEDLLIILPPGTPIPRADKGSFIRRKIYVQFEQEISKAYADLEGDGRGATEVGSLETVKARISEIVQSVAGSKESIGAEEDLFSYGLDSLAATQIRNSLQRTFNLGGKKLPLNFVFEQPTIANLAAYLVSLTTGNAIVELSQEEQMLQLVERYSHFDVPPGLPPTATSEPSLACVLLSGATGSLGANQLANLLERKDVKKVFVLVRAASHDEAAIRVKASLKEKALPGGNDGRIVALAADFSQEKLGLSVEIYKEIEAEVTTVLHYAWSVNFNLSIASFEPHIRGAYNCINLCLNSTKLAAFYFASSVSAVAAYAGPTEVPEAVTEDPKSAQGMGYARSKWVTEKICQKASLETPVRAVVLRIGQMVGSTIDGRWNETEAVSLMIKTGDTLHALPELAETPSWLPVDCAAATIVDLALLTPPKNRESQCWHVLQPRLITFSSVLDSLAAAGMKFERLSPSDWIEALRNGPQDPVTNPTIKLLSFFEKKYAKKDESEAAEPPSKRYGLQCHKTLEASESLRRAPLVDELLVQKYMNCWRQTGFLVKAE